MESIFVPVEVSDPEDIKTVDGDQNAPVRILNNSPLHLV